MEILLKLKGKERIIAVSDGGISCGVTYADGYIVQDGCFIKNDRFMNDIISIKDEHILEATSLYIKVFNSEPWNDNWTLETAYKRLKDI
ncbi:MAG TPA: hypothetical protein VIK72_07925 [Clostridiaceae bacterium]